MPVYTIRRGGVPASPIDHACRSVSYTLPMRRCRRGVEVNFPHECYPCQLDYMERVIEALQTVSPGPDERLRMVWQGVGATAIACAG